MNFLDIEELVGFNLPESYKKLILNYPPHLRRLCEANGYQGSNSLLFDSLGEIYKVNQIVHAPDYCYENENGDDCEWPGPTLQNCLDGHYEFFHMEGA